MNPEVFALSIVILLLSVIIHEVAHGMAARYFGDHTAQRASRLTLNPIPHIDPVGTLLLPLVLILTQSPILFGWAKPVPVNPLNFRDIKRGELATAAAGVLTNLGLAILGALIFHLIPFTVSPLVKNLALFTVRINSILAVFNLLPIPPLDGSKVVMALLPPHLENQFRQLERYGFFIIILLWLVPFGSSSVLGTILGFFLEILHSLLGV